MRNFTELDMYLFGQGTHYDIGKKLGAHFAKDENGLEGVVFDVWAPHAASVAVIGDFNGWDEGANYMERLMPQDIGIFETFIPGVQEGALYKFLIYTYDGNKIYKADPYASWAELRPGTASRVAKLSGFRWTDDEWMKARATGKPFYERPISIYECHPGSWMRHPGRDDGGMYTYRELAKSLTDYVKDMGYTHVELMGDRKSTRLNSSHPTTSRMPSSA